MEATQTATGYVSAATVLSAGQEGAKAMTIAEKLIAATSKKARKAAILLLRTEPDSTAGHAVPRAKLRARFASTHRSRAILRLLPTLRMRVKLSR